MTSATVAGRLHGLARKKHIPLLVLRVADFERIAWRDGKTAARRLERHARDAFVRITSERMRAADVPVHDPGSELFAVALCTGTRLGDGNALPAGCRSALARATAELARILPLSIETGWTLMSDVAHDASGFEAALRTALWRGALERQRYDFFAGAGHEMRAPLTAIRGYLETLLEKDAHPRTARRFLEIARNETLRLGRLIDGMFQVSLLDIEPRDTTMSRARETTTLRAALDAALGALGPRMRERHASVHVAAVQDEAVSIGFDHLVQALVNVIGNALEHGAEDGRIAISASSNAQAVAIQIEDDGPGIPPAEREAIFTFGYRARSAGTGLGLAVVRRLLERAGGEVHAGESLLGGAQIVILIPRCEPVR